MSLDKTRFHFVGPPFPKNLRDSKGEVPAAIFDLDGTILNTLLDLKHSLNSALARLGFPEHTLESCLNMVGFGIQKLVRDALPSDQRENPDTFAKLYEAFKEDYAIHQTNKSLPYPGIPEFLDTLASFAWKLAVLSNKNLENTIQVVKHFFPGQFNFVLGVSPEIPPKPNPIGAQKLLELMGKDRESVFYFGDTFQDMKLATDMGFIPIGVSWGFRGKDEISAGGAEIIIDYPADFLAFLIKTYA
ncbi:MAG: HAD family hydrolase [Deltaproteobacteria bacterium]|jgi:phosphoglycolate phosphatase|nr:HAD family hydrolase [Deltaproteobacteria bacterium]